MSLSPRIDVDVICQLQVARVKAISVSSGPCSLRTRPDAARESLRGGKRGSDEKRHYVDRTQPHYQSKDHMARMRARRAVQSYYDETTEVYQLSLWRES